MKIQVLIFYGITTLLLSFTNLLGDASIVGYLQVLYVVFTFAESYFVLQNFDFKHGLPYFATFFKLLNTIVIFAFPKVAFVLHIIVHVYIYSHIRGLDKRHKRLKYDYTVNNLIPGPLVLKIFCSFLNPLYFVVITILASLRIYQKVRMVNAFRILTAFVICDIVVLILKFTIFNKVAFLIYMVMLILFEFIPLNNKLKNV